MIKNHKLNLLPPKVDYSFFIRELSEANRILGNLNGLVANIPNQGLLISPLLTKEAVASSKIEGTQATIEEVFTYEAQGKSTEKDPKEQDIREIINYRVAINEAMEILKNRPLGENFIKQLHSILLDSVRCANKDRGNFRRIPVFISKPGAKIEDAIYIPPDCAELTKLTSNWEKYVNSELEPDVLVQTAIAHYQFEAIHPFLDGNGRIGRLLIPIILYDKGALNYPLLYISEFFERNKEEYYYFLRMVDGQNDWESWIRYFLLSIKEQARDTRNKVLSMLDLYRSIKEKLVSFNSQYSVQLLDIIFENPVITVKSIKEKMSTNSYQTIYNVIGKFEQEKILAQSSQGKRNKVYVFEELLDIVK